MKYVYKAVAAIASLVVIPAFMFLSNIYYKFSSVAMQIIVTALANRGNTHALEILEQNNGVAPSAIADSISFRELLGLSDSVSGLLSGSVSETLAVLKTPAITLAVIGVLIMVCAAVTACIAIFAKNNRKVYYSSLAGIGLSIMFKFAFESVAAPFLDGTISLADLLESFAGVFVANAEAVELSTTFYFIPLIFLGVIVWTAIYNFTLPENEKKARKAMLKEADK